MTQYMYHRKGVTFYKNYRNSRAFTCTGKEMYKAVQNGSEDFLVCKFDKFDEYASKKERYSVL